MSGTLKLWTVTHRPSDLPGVEYAARAWIIPTAIGEPGGATDELVTAPTLAELRALLPAGLTRIPRHELDDPVIVEVWL